MVDNPQTQEEQLLNLQQRARKKGVKKQLLLVTALNLFTFLCVIFAMGFYQWIWVELSFDNVFDSEVHCYWVNLLYMKKDADNTPYETFNTVKKRICHNIYCSGVIEGIKFSGYLCFSIFTIAASMQLIDFSRMIYYILRLGTILETKGNFRHIVLIGAYYVGLTLSAFSLSVVQKKSIRFGISFWFCVAVLTMFAVVLVYGQFSMKKMVKQALIQNLLWKQKNLRTQQIRETSSEFVQNQQQSSRKLTL